MKRNLKRMVSAILGAGAGALLFGAVACSATDGSGDLLAETKLWLDRYEECALPVKDGVDLSSLTVTSDHEDLVRYENGTVISTGKAEKTTDVTLTVKHGKSSAKLSVKVRDSGAVPELSMPDPSVYLGVAIDLPVSVMYLDKEMPADVTQYEAEEIGGGIVSYENGKIEGLALGETQLAVTLVYKGYECADLFDVAVKPANVLEFNTTSLEIYQADSKLSRAQITPKVVKAGHVVENAAVTYEVTSGAGNITVSESGAVQALKSGAATIKATYTADPSVYGELPVIIHENYVKESFTPSPVGGVDPADGVEKITTYEAETGEIGGRSSADMYKLTLGYINNEDNAKTEMWGHRILVSEYGTNFVEAYRKGYRYFAYDLYYKDGEVITADGKEYHKPYTTLYVGSGGDASHPGALCEFIDFNQYFHRSYLRILQQNGEGEWEETNVLRKEQWVRVVYDMKYYAFNYPNAVVGFFFTSGQTGAQAYFDNIRYYLDGEFLPEETRTYEQKDGFVQATNEELHVYGVDSGTTYEKAGAVDGVTDDGVHTNAYRYVTPGKASGWNNQLVVVPSDDSSIGVGMLNLTEHGNYLTFDFYTDNALELSLTMGHWLYSKTIRLTAGKKVGTSLETDKYIAAIKDGKRLYTLPQGEWVTVSLAFRDAYQPISGWSRASIFVALTGANETAYIDNVRYYETNSYIPAEFDGERPVSDYYIADGVYESVSFAKSADGEQFAGSVKYTSSLTSAIIDAEERWNDGLKFSNIHDSAFHPAGDFYDKGYHYISFKMYATGNFGGIAVQSWCNDGKGAKQYTANLTPGKKTALNVYLMKEDGTYARYIETDTWYTFTIPVEYAAKPTNWSSIYYRLLKGDGDGEAVAYLKDLSYHNTKPADVPRDADEYLQVTFGDPSGGTKELITEGDFKNSYKFTLNMSGSWKSALILGDTSSPVYTAKYVFAEIYMKDVTTFNTQDQLGFMANKDNYNDPRTIGVDKTDGVVLFYDMEGNPVTTVQNETWYKMAVPVKGVPNKTWGTLRMFFEFDTSATSNATVYLRNADYGNTNIYAE